MAEDRLSRLLAVRTMLEMAMSSGMPARDLAATSREYRSVLADIAALEGKAPKEGDGIDEIAQRRAGRTSAGKGAARARKSG